MQESKTSNGGDGTERVALPYKQAVEIATGGSGVGSFEQFDSLGLTASQITRVSNGTYRGPNGRPIKTVEAEAIIAKADPDVYRLSPEAVANIRYNLDSLAQGKLPIGIKRDFNKSLAQQAQEERAVLEAQLALSDAIDARDADVRVVARERSEIAQKKLEREDEGVLQRELRRVEAET